MPESQNEAWLKDRRWCLHIPDYWPPSLNKTQMAHWSEVRKHKGRALQLVHTYTLRQDGQMPIFVGKVNVCLYRIIGYRGRGMDVDNLNGSVKPLVDALRAPKVDRSGGKQGGLGIIEDDDAAHLDLEVYQVQYHRVAIAGLMAALDYPPLLGDPELALSFHPDCRPPTSTLIVIRGDRRI